MRGQEIEAPPGEFAGDEAGRTMYALIERLYPICRSLTGDGVRRTLDILRELLPLDVHEVPSGTPAFDWEVPREWNIRDAYIADSGGRRVVDFRQHNLHVVSYSGPVRTRLSLDALKEHLFSLPDSPDWIPYRTSYYRESWGFCIADRELRALVPGEYEVVIDSSLEPGSLTYGELSLAGESDDEVLISTHICHPSLCNDNLSGIAVATALASRLLERRGRRYTYRFLYTPGAIGSIAWLSRNEERVDSIRHGLVLACVGDAGPPTYKRSRRGDAEIDKAVEHVLGSDGTTFGVRDFTPYGYDERQFCSPGFDLPVGCFTRTPHGEFPEYHTSADDLSLVTPGALGDSLRRLLEVVDVLERNRTYLNLNPKCEPQLGRRGLYGTIGGGQQMRERELALLWVLNLSDGKHSLLEIAQRASLPFSVVADAAAALVEVDLLRGTSEVAL